MGALREVLKSRGFVVVDDTYLRPGLPIQESLSQAIQSSDVALALISDHPSTWIANEMGIASGLNKPTFQILLGQAAGLKMMDNFESIRVKDFHEISGLGERLSSLIRSSTERRT